MASSSDELARLWEDLVEQAPMSLLFWQGEPPAPWCQALLHGALVRDVVIAGDVGTSPLGAWTRPDLGPALTPWCAQDPGRALLTLCKRQAPASLQGPALLGGGRPDAWALRARYELSQAELERIAGDTTLPDGARYGAVMALSRALPPEEATAWMVGALARTDPPQLPLLAALELLRLGATHTHEDVREAGRGREASEKVAMEWIAAQLSAQGGSHR